MTPLGQSLLRFGLFLLSTHGQVDALSIRDSKASGREEVNINSDWKFSRFELNPDGVIYDKRPDLENLTDVHTLKPWVLPSGNDFIKDPSDRHERPEEDPDIDVPYIRNDYDDKKWETVNLPHDWAIEGPFYTEPDNQAIVGGGMGRLPVHGIGWYRRTLEKTSEDEGKQIYLDIDGAMSYAIVWLNGNLVGGWPYGYNSFRLNLTPYLKKGKKNQLAIRLDNPVKSARWYPGGGLYRDVRLVKVGETHVGQWGTYITSKDVSSASATLDMSVEIEHHGKGTAQVNVVTDIHIYDSGANKVGQKVAGFPRREAKAKSGEKTSIKSSIQVKNPRLWGPPPTQKPNLYMAVTTLYNAKGNKIDSYQTQFGIRRVEHSGEKGLIVNGEQIRIQGVNQHHDLGAIGAAWNARAAERQLEILREMGVNSVRTSHNPPAPELLDLTDRLGFLVMDEIFDSWTRKKTDCDFSLIFDDWHEADVRSFMRRDRNHASIIMWSYGNEVGEQQISGSAGAELSIRLRDIVREEDHTRPSTASLNYAQPGNNGDEFVKTMDVLSLNYQGGGIRDTANYAHLSGIKTSPAYSLFQSTYPDKLLLSSESASALSSRGTYFFPVVSGNLGAPINDTSGGNSTLAQVSAYELYTADYGSCADKEFLAQDKNPTVAGEYVWTGWDYLGEPTPYYTSRSSYSGIIDLAGFPKDRFYLYQARWRPDLPMVHIVPHWNWPDRQGQVTPVHVFTSGDEAELFLNGKSLGRKKREALEYRLRWDDVKYSPGELRVVSYKKGKQWAKATVRTTGEAEAVRLTADRKAISSDGLDLSFLTAEIVDEKGDVVPTASNMIQFSVGGGGKLVATDNGDAADMNVFSSEGRKAFSGKALVIISGKGKAGDIVIKAKSKGLKEARVIVRAK